MPSRRRLLTPDARHLLGALAGLLSVVLVVVDAGYAPASQAGQSAGAGSPPAPADVAEAEHGEAQARPDLQELREASGAEQPQPADSADGAEPPQPAHGHDVAERVERVGVEQAETRAEVPATHVVQPGETAGGIADHYGVATKALVRANRHARPDVLRPGDLLVVPDPHADQPRTPQEALTADLEVEQVLEETARRYGWNPATVKAIAWYESRWNQRVVSDKEAIGVMQVQPTTGELMERLLDRPLDLYDLRDNVEAGVAYLDRLHRHHGGNLRAIIAAYHQGPEALRTRGIYRVSDAYTDEVLRLRTVFAG
jgi:LysM repeat protein